MGVMTVQEVLVGAHVVVTTTVITTIMVTMAVEMAGEITIALALAVRSKGMHDVPPGLLHFKAAAALEVE